VKITNTGMFVHAKRIQFAKWLCHQRCGNCWYAFS